MRGVGVIQRPAEYLSPSHGPQLPTNGRNCLLSIGRCLVPRGLDYQLSIANEPMPESLAAAESIQYWRHGIAFAVFILARPGQCGNCHHERTPPPALYPVQMFGQAYIAPSWDNVESVAVAGDVGSRR